MSLLIKNVHILVSDQKLPESLDVFINGEKIIAIGRFPGKKADRIIDGQGCYLSPGFIDLHTESDHYLSLFDYPSQEDFLKQGVTTILGGLCGASLAPLIYGSLDLFEEWANTTRVNVNWHSVKEFMETFSRRRLGINFATLVGHSTIRQALIGKVYRNLNKNELKVFASVLKKSIQEGAFGFSTGLGYVQAKNTPYSEIKTLAEVAKSAGGIYATHLRDDTKGLVDSISEVIKLTKETNISTIISHLLPVQGFEKDYEIILKQFEALPEDFPLNFTLYPSEIRILKLYTFLPEWAQKDDLGVMLQGLKDEWLKEKITKELPEVDPNKFIIAQASQSGSLVGKSLFELKKIFNLKNYKETLTKVMAATGLQASIFYENLNPKLIRESIKNRRSLIVSNAASIKDDPRVKILKPERATSTFTKFLSIVQTEKIIDFESAIRKITYEPARKLGLSKRGVVKDGYFADLVGFKNGKISFVIVGGELSVEDGQFTGKLGGKFLKRSK